MILRTLLRCSELQLLTVVDFVVIIVVGIIIVVVVNFIIVLVNIIAVVVVFHLFVCYKLFPFV